MDSEDIGLVPLVLSRLTWSEEILNSVSLSLSSKRYRDIKRNHFPTNLSSGRHTLLNNYVGFS